MPITDEQAKLGQEALKALGAVGRFLREVIGTYPEDLVGYYLGGDWLKVRRAENLSRMIEELQHLLKARNVKPDSPSISIALPLLIAAADESRDELRSIWARLLAAAADPARAKSFRIQFIEVVKQMDPLDAAVLDATHSRQRVTAGPTNESPSNLK
jgi:Abortive infection alpha